MYKHRKAGQETELNRDDADRWINEYIIHKWEDILSTVIVCPSNKNPHLQVNILL
jgi:hypothetical protein